MSRPPLLFDLDGCVVDSLASIVRCWEETLPGFGLPVPPVEVLRANVGPPVNEVAAAYAPGWDHESVAQIVAAYRARSVLAEDVEPFAGMPELLRSLRNHGHRLAIATSKSQEVVEPLLARLGLAELFEVVECTRVQESGTDKATIVARAIAALGPPRPGAHVGDRRHDVEGAHANGLLAVGVLWGYGGEAELRTAGADLMVASPADLGRALREV